MICTATAAGLFFSIAAYGGDWAVFPAIGAVQRSADVAGQPRGELDPIVDLFYDGGGQQFRLLGEYQVARDGGEIERLQLGWRPTPVTTAWIGRFHTPMSYWVAEFQHAPFLQTSITHPGSSFDDEDGPFITHVLGALLEGNVYYRVSALYYGVGLGIGPVLRNSSLRPPEVFRPADNDGGPAASLRVGYRPNATAGNEIGLSAGHARIPVQGPFVGDVDQNLVAAYANFSHGPVRVFGQVFFAHNNSPALSRESRFASGYAQVESHVGQRWTLFGRAENTSAATDDRYLALLPRFIYRRLTGGVRRDLDSHQALTVEWSRDHREDGAHYDELAVQYCMVFP